MRNVFILSYNGLNETAVLRELGEELNLYPAPHGYVHRLVYRGTTTEPRMQIYFAGLQGIVEVNRYELYLPHTVWKEKYVVMEGVMENTFEWVDIKN